MTKSKLFAQSEDAEDPPDLPGDDTVPRQRPGRKPHEPSQIDRDTVMAMVAAGIAIEDIARVRGMGKNTLRRHYSRELKDGHTVLNTMVIVEWIKKIKAGDFAAIKWWTQARMGYSEKLTVDDPSRDKPMRVIVELVGDPAPPAARPVIAAATPAPSLRVPSTMIQFKGADKS